MSKKKISRSSGYVTRRLDLLSSSIVNSVHDILRHKLYAPGKELGKTNSDDFKQAALNWVFRGLLIEALQSGKTKIRIPYLTHEQVRAGYSMKEMADDECMEQFMAIDISKVVTTAALKDQLSEEADVVLAIAESLAESVTRLAHEQADPAPAPAITAPTANVVVDSKPAAEEKGESAVEEIAQEALSEGDLDKLEDAFSEDLEEVAQEEEVVQAVEPEGDAHKQMDLVEASESASGVDQPEDAGVAPDAEEEDFVPIAASEAKQTSVVSDVQAQRAERVRRIQEAMAAGKKDE